MKLYKISLLEVITSMLFPQLKLLFLFQKSSSRKKQNIHQTDKVEDLTDAFTHSTEYFEAPPEGAVPGIKLRNLKKVHNFHLFMTFQEIKSLLSMMYIE